MTPEEKENALRAQAHRCAEEITKAMSVKPKPKWNAVCPPSFASTTRRSGRWVSAWRNLSVLLGA